MLWKIISYTCLYERKLPEQKLAKNRKAKIWRLVIKLLKFVRFSKLLLNIMIF